MRKLKIIWGLIKVLLPESIVRMIYGGRREVIAGRTIDPKAQAAGDLVRLIRDPNQMPSIEESRAQLAGMASKFDDPCPSSVTLADIMLPGAAEDRPARIYTPEGRDAKAAGPTMLYLHGGGWVQGGIDTHDGLCGRLADQAGLRVISYDYRLAPEHRFPAAADDILACYRALVAEGNDLQVDATQLVVGGDSAGANLAAALMHDIATMGLAKPRAQLLIYPAVDARLETQSMKDLADQPLLPLTRIKWFLDLYLPKDQDWMDPRVSPLFSDKLDGQPMALIVAGGHDPLWDDGRAYAEALGKAGVDVEVLEYPGQVHAFMSLTKVIPQGHDAAGKVAKWLCDDVFDG